MENPLNSISGLTFDRLLDRVTAYFPGCSVGEDTDGNLVLHLNHYLDNGVVTPFEEDN